MKIKNLWANATTRDIVNERQTRSIVQLDTEMGRKTRHCKAVDGSKKPSGENSPKSGIRRVWTVDVGEATGKQKACASPQLGAQETSYA